MSCKLLLQDKIVFQRQVSDQDAAVPVVTTAGMAGMAGMAGIGAIPVEGDDDLVALSFFAKTPTTMLRTTMTIRNRMMTQSFAASAIW